MNQKSNLKIINLLTLFFSVVSILYLIIVIHPAIWFNKIQPPFLVTSEFLHSYLKYPGGLTDWLGNFIMQSFYYPIFGPIVLVLVIFSLTSLIYILLQHFQKDHINKLLVMLIPMQTVLLVSDYNFPFSVITSVIIPVIAIIPVTKIKNHIVLIIYFLLSSVLVYYTTGSGYLWVFTVSVFLIQLKQNVNIKWVYLGYFAFVMILVIWIGFNYVFAISKTEKLFRFFTQKYYYLNYDISFTFLLYVFSIPILLTIQYVIKQLKNYKEGNKIWIRLNYILATAIVAIAVFIHINTFNSEERKIADCDYYCFKNQSEKIEKTAMSLQNYNFSANMNYNLSILKSGELTSKFFDFFQISGTDALYPDYLFQSDISFVAAEFYYELGYISEARHWAYESLVNYPYSLRTLEILVQIHLVTKEYKAAEKYLRILKKGIIRNDFINRYEPYFSDTMLIQSDSEIIQKRSFIPEYKELPVTPVQRFVDLLEVNPSNKNAFECMMLYYMLAGDFDNFIKHYNEVKNYFNKPVPIYEEAILMYAAANNRNAAEEYNISDATIENFASFTNELKKYGTNRNAMDKMYAEFGKTYLYYFQFVYPRIVKPNYGEEENELPAI